MAHYTPERLYSIINAGSIRLPLSHSRALEIIAKLNGLPNWNVAATMPHTEIAKAEAKVLRIMVNERIIDGRLPLEAADEIIIAVLAAANACDLDTH